MIVMCHLCPVTVAFKYFKDNSVTYYMSYINFERPLCYGSLLSLDITLTVWETGISNIDTQLCTAPLCVNAFNHKHIFAV